jgi:hypothetical protein
MNDDTSKNCVEDFVSLSEFNECAGTAKLILQVNSLFVGIVGKMSLMCPVSSFSDGFAGFHNRKKLEFFGSCFALEINSNPLNGSFQ